MERYENEGWKAGVVYPCGAAVIGGRLFVYYGGADKVTCVASADLDDFIKKLTGVRTFAAGTAEIPAGRGMAGGHSDHRLPCSQGLKSTR